MAGFMIVSAGPNTSRLVYLVFYGLAALLGLALIGAVAGGAPAIVVLSFTILFAVFLAIPTHEYLIQSRIRRALRILRNIITDLRGYAELGFGRPVKIRPVVFNVRATRSWAPMGSQYLWSTIVEPESNYERRNTHVFEDRGYAIIAGRGGEGEAFLPGLEFDEPGLQGIVLLYVPSRQPLVKGSRYAYRGPSGETVEVRIHEGQGIRGEARLMGRGRATIYLAARTPGMPRQVRLKLAELRGEGATLFSARLAPESPLLIVAHRKSSLRGIAWHLPKPLIAGDMPSYSIIVEFKRGRLERIAYERGLHVTRTRPMQNK